MLCFVPCREAYQQHQVTKGPLSPKQPNQKQRRKLIPKQQTTPKISPKPQTRANPPKPQTTTSSLGHACYHRTRPATAATDSDCERLGSKPRFDPNLCTTRHIYEKFAPAAPLPPELSTHVCGCLALTASPKLQQAESPKLQTWLFASPKPQTQVPLFW